MCALQCSPTIFYTPICWANHKISTTNNSGRQIQRRGFFVTSNTHLSSVKPLGYLDKELFNPEEEALANLLKEWKNSKRDLETMVREVAQTPATANIKRIADNLLTIYRKAKFTYLPDDIIRNECDQLVALLDKWDFKLNHPRLGRNLQIVALFSKDEHFWPLCQISVCSRHCQI